MVSIPKILTNKTVLTGLASSPMKSSSLFGPVNTSSVFKPVGSTSDLMGKVSKPAPTPFFKNGKISGFSPNSPSFTAYIPAGLGRPNFVQGKMVSFR
mmetsp:Transcript_6169/g.7996  ORF Transcript_6169/g.7996 Transcript_6169/m.7996 type:complete len:97 (+) Transcript_6169:105-395(+)|eukprot:CAMPEP_0198136500 /NCGR_PEP_ID=MMETSP1443-20131203/148_1 /TAXON_ID=186043 /ORGANISM="Entomoneis sp., Strain CCMP2396" /LENGTH=96 /DNA_ID=CAMNT_0043797727 /DNA_START=75 /DNA_END=365 /DNA_ORIENTATION=+